MRRYIILGLVLGFAGFVYGGALETGNLPAGVQWVAHFDSDGFQQSKIYTLLMEGADKSLLESRVNFCKSVLGFDPMKDMQGITFYGTGYGEQETVVLFSGKIDQEKIVTLLKLNGSYEEQDHAGKTIMAWQDPKNGKKGALCFFSPDLTIMTGDAGKLKEAVDVLGGSAESVRSISGDQAMPAGVFFSLEARASGGQIGNAPQAALLQSAEWLSISAGETGEKMSLTASVKAVTEEQATNMEQFLRGIQAFSMLNTNVQDKGSAIMKGASVSRSGDTVNVLLSSDAQTLMDMIKQHTARKPHGPRHGRKPSTAGQGTQDPVSAPQQ